MDFLDPKKRRHHATLLIVGYVLIAIAILITVRVLLYVAYGYGLGKDGQIIQNGLVYVSSTPSGSKMYLDGQLRDKTNSRLQLPSGQYALKIERDGYRTWQRSITVLGGAVEHFDYPFLFPTSLTTTNVRAYDAWPGLATQSPSRQWLLVQQPGDPNAFDMFNLKNKHAVSTVSLPEGLTTPSRISQSWQFVEWSSDNRHVLLKHMYGDASEFIVVDTQDPTQSVNLNRTLNMNPTQLVLRNKKYDQYYIYDAAKLELDTATLSNPQPTAYVSQVLSYKSYGSNIMLYTTGADAPAGKVFIKLLQNGQTYTLRTATAGTTYLLDLAQYSGNWYAAVGASGESKVYIYKNPVAQLGAANPVLVPSQILKVTNPNYLSFSNNAQFIMGENGTQFEVYDIKNNKSYTYTATAPLDAPQTHASWMDGDRLDYVSGGKLVVFDYDHANVQTLMPADPRYIPFFDPSYKFVDSFAAPQAAASQAILTSTALLTPADQ